MVQAARVRGSPSLQMIFVVVAVALAGVPVWRLTRPAAVAAAIVATPSASSPDTRPLPLDVEAIFAPAPTDFQIKNLDQTVLTGHGPQARFTTRWAGSVPPDGVDFVVQAHWPAANAGATATASAARVTVRFPDGRTVEKSFWAAANGTLTEVFTLPGATTAQTP